MVHRAQLFGCVAVKVARLETENGQIIEFTDSGTMCYRSYLKAISDSVPGSATKIQTPTTLGWGFFLPVCANSRVFSRVPSESCGLRLRHR